MRSFLWKINLYTFVDAFILIAAIFALYFTAHGLNPFQISILIAIWSAVILLLEVPMGVLADKYSRRNLLIISTLCRGFGFLIWLLFPSFWGFAVGFIFWGLRNVLASGTYEAFIYDELKTTNNEHLYGKSIGQANGFMYIGLMVSSAVGGFIATEYNFQIVLIISVLTSVLASIVLFFIKSVKPTKPTDEIHSFTILKRAVSQVRRSKNLFAIITFITLIFGTYVAVDDFWPLIFNNFNFNVAEVGALIAIVYGIAALASYTAHLSEKIKLKSLVYILVLTGGFLYLIVGLFKLPVLIPIIFIGVYLLKAADIKFEAKLQHSIESGQRATITSIKSLSVEVMYMILVLLFGFVGTQFGLLSILIIAGGLITITTLIYWKTTKNILLNQK